GFQGEYWTGEDINIGLQDVEVLAQHTKYVIGRSGGSVRSGDPSPFTAGGCFAGMRAALQFLYGTSDLVGRHVALQGVGNVGLALASLIAKAGGTLVVADVRPEHAERARAVLSAAVVSPEDIYDQVCDVFSPCAMGGTLTSDSARRLRA